MTYLCEYRSYHHDTPFISLTLYQALPDSKKAGYLVRLVMSNDFYPIPNIVMGKGQGLYQTVLGNPGTSCLTLVRIATLGGLPPTG